MDIVKVKSEDAVSTIQDFIYNNKLGFAYCLHDEKSVFIADPKDVDRSICMELGYNVLETLHTGGVVVVNEGDVSVVHFGEIGNNVMHDLANYLIKKYREKRSTPTSFLSVE